MKPKERVPLSFPAQDTSEQDRLPRTHPTTATMVLELVISLLVSWVEENIPERESGLQSRLVPLLGTV